MNTRRNGQDSSHGDAGRDDRSQVAECSRLLRERFPHLDRVSLELLARDETFGELCDEYFACTEVVERLSRSGTDAPLLREYTALRLRVEAELLGYISTRRDTDDHR